MSEINAKDAKELIDWIKTHTRPLAWLSSTFEVRELPNGTPIVMQWWDDKNGFEIFVPMPNAVADTVTILNHVLFHNRLPIPAETQADVEPTLADRAEHFITQRADAGVPGFSYGYWGEGGEEISEEEFNRRVQLRRQMESEADAAEIDDAGMKPT